jgi:hypothetical protein
VVNRILAYCNYTPILLQEFGSGLIEALHARPLRDDELPQIVASADIEAVLGGGYGRPTYCGSSDPGTGSRTACSASLAKTPRRADSLLRMRVGSSTRRPGIASR